MKVIYNKTQGVNTRIDDWIQFYVGEGQKGLSASFAIVIHLPNKAVAPLAFFSEKDEAEKCMTEIMDFAMSSDFGIHEIEDNVKESILIAPDSLKQEAKLQRIK